MPEPGAFFYFVAACALAITQCITLVMLIQFVILTNTFEERWHEAKHRIELCVMAIRHRETIPCQLAYWLLTGDESLEHLYDH